MFDGGDMRAFMIAAFGSMVTFGLTGTALAQVVLDASTFDALEEQNPDHYGKVEEALRAWSEEGCISAARALRTQFDVKNAHCEPALLRTSYPPKQRLTFTLDGRPYVVFVAVHLVGMKFFK